MIKNVEVIQKLKNKQSRAIILLEGKSIEEVAKALGIAVNTVYRWLEIDETFKNAFNEVREKIFSEALEDLKTGSREAVRTLREVMRTGNKETAKVGSVKIAGPISIVAEVALQTTI